MEKSRKLAIVFILSALIITGCGILPSREPTPTVDLRLSDEEFAVKAKSVCDDLQAELEAAQTLEQESAVFSEAATEMKAYALNPETAPQAVILRDGMAALSDACLDFDTALDEAVEEYEWDEYTWMIFGSTVTAYSNAIGVFGMQTLDVDGAIVQGFLDNWQAVSEAAEALGLGGCQLDDDNDS